MRDYDINDYWTKSELSADRLQTILTTNLRSYQQISNIANAKRGLQLIAESSGALHLAQYQRTVEQNASTIGNSAKFTLGRHSLC